MVNDSETGMPALLRTGCPIGMIFVRGKLVTFRKPYRSTPVVLGDHYRQKLRQRRRRTAVARAGFGSAIFLGIFGTGMVATNWPTVSKAAAPIVGRITGSNFGICNSPQRWNCVVDGDTFWMNGRKIRIADIDTPEVSEPQCQAEYDLGMEATRRLQELLNEAPFEVRSFGDRDVDRYGRELRVVIRGGRSIGDQLVSEGLARTWTGRRQPWC